MRIRKKVLPVLLSLALAIGLCPATALAEEPIEKAVPPSKIIQTYSTRQSATDALNKIKTRQYFKPSGQCPSGKNVGWLRNGSWNCDNECYAFAAGVCEAMYGCAPGGTSGYRLTRPGNFYTVGTVTSPTINSVKNLLMKGYPGDVVQFHGGSGGYGSWQHTFILEKVSDAGITIYEHVNKPRHIRSHYLTWSQFYSKAYAHFSAVSSHGISLYHYKWYDSKYPNSTPTAKAPAIKPHDVLGGKKIQLVDNQGSATIRYMLDGKNDPSAVAGTVYSGTWINDTWPTMGVRAIATKSGMSASSVTRQTIYTGLTAAPHVNQSNTASGTTVELKSDTKAATIFYTLDGTNPTFDIKTGKSNGKKYTGPFSLTANCTVKALAVASGMRASSVTTESITCVAPGTPTVTAESEAIAQGDAVKIAWNRNPAVASYIATLYKDGSAVDTQTTTSSEAVFVLSEAGTYAVGVKAANAIGESAESSRISIEAMAPLTVRFMSVYTDENGNEISRVDDEQSVKYGYDAQMPEFSPKRRGYTFINWSSQPSNVKKDTDVVARWSINEYPVKFYAADGKTLLSQQNIEFGQAATAPDPGTAPTGKVFSGWAVTDADDDSARDYTKVDSKMSLRAVFAWADEELPVVAEITNAERTASGNYTVHVKLTNHPTDITTALLRVALKTSDDKLVQTSRETVEIGNNGTIEKDVVLKYNGDNVATVAEVEVVGLDGNYRTGGAYSKAVQREIVSMDNFYYTDWSEWSTEKLATSDNTEVEEATQYRFRDKQYTKSTATSMSGWDRGSSTTTYGGWSANKTTTSKPATSDTQRITGQSTKYTYYRWCNYYDNCQNQDSVAYGKNCTYHEVTLSSPMTACANKFADKGGKAWDLHGPYGSCAHRKAGISYWWTKSKVTTYTYQTRTKTVTYDYSKWSDWGDWGFDEAVASAEKEVQTQKVYRSRTKQPGAIQGKEDTTGTKQAITGSLSTGTDLAGKEATIMVYNVTNSDPNEDQVQYIGQTTIGAGNAYSFSFTPRQDPSVESGDFIVSLGVKGSTGLVNVATIKAPRAQYTVTYQYEKADGSTAVISEQQVNAGEDATAPEPPTREGCQFLGWSRAASGIDRDMVINAIFAERTCTIAWVDHQAEDVLLQTVPFGSTLEAPADHVDVEGYTFKGWGALLSGTTQATGDMVIKATYEPVKHTVMFLNYDGTPFKTVQVEHGKAAELPEANPTAPGMEFVSWGTTSQTPWWSVTKDLAVKPLFAYENTVSSPYSSVELASGYVGAKGAKVYLEAPTDGSTIYYTLDGSDPAASEAAALASTFDAEDEAELPSESDMDKAPGITHAYNPDEGITVTKAVTIRAMACASGMNDSSITEIPVNVTATNDISKAEAFLTSAPYYYGAAVEPGVMVYLGDELLDYDKDYTVTYSNNNGLGKATATIKGKGAYTGQQKLEFNITNPPADENGTSTDSPNPSKPTSGTWKQSSGKWWYAYDNGGYAKGWCQIGGTWYLFDNAGWMLTGWQKVGNTWYYLNSSGAMATGWLKTGGSWYYLSGSGAMQTGWAKIGSSWYYLSSSGAMKTGWLQLGGKWSYLDGSGAMATSWRQVGGKWYHLNGSGVMSRNCWVGNYYLTDSGAMATNTWIGKYHVNASGVWDKTR